MALSFRATLRQWDSGAAVEVPEDILKALGGGKRPAVRVVINGVELRTTIAVYGGQAYIGLRREIRDAAEVAPGEVVELSVELDAAPRSVELPENLAAALAAHPEAKRTFDALSFTNRKEYVSWVTNAKRHETRQKRIADAVTLLEIGRRTPMAR